MSIIRTNLGERVLCATALSFAITCLGCGHANNPNNGSANTSANLSTAQGNSQDVNQTGDNQNANPSTQAKDFIKFSHNGHAAIENIEAARTEIFNGHPHQAIQMMTKAQSDIQAAEREAPDFKNTVDRARAGNSAVSQAGQSVTLVPVDAGMSMDEAYAVTPEKQTHIDQANEHLKNGDVKGAADEFKLAGVDVNYTMVFMPIASSQQKLQQAIDLANQGHYYKSSLALKSIEDGLLVDSENMDGTPRNGEQANGTQNNGAQNNGDQNNGDQKGTPSRTPARTQ